MQGTLLEYSRNYFFNFQMLYENLKSRKLFSLSQKTQQDLPCISLTKIHLSQEMFLKHSFRDLPFDPYLENRYRQRRFSSFCVAGDRLMLLSYKPFCQSSEFNPLLGGIERNYPELTSAVARSTPLKQIIQEFIHRCGLTRQTVEVGVHQIRISCSSNHFGNPAPEGIHQDGYKFVGIYCVERENVQGGVTLLYKSRDEKPCFSSTLAPGEFLIFSDENFYHFTSPIKSAGLGLGFRHVLILTAKHL